MMLNKTQYKVWATGKIEQAIGNFNSIEEAKHFAKARFYNDYAIVRVEHFVVGEFKRENVKTSN